MSHRAQNLKVPQAHSSPRLASPTIVALHNKEFEALYANTVKVYDAKMGAGSTAVIFGSYIRPLLVWCVLMFDVVRCYAHNPCQCTTTKTMTLKLDPMAIT